MCIPSLRRDTCHGHEWGAAFCPFTTRVEWNGLLPHPLKRVDEHEKSNTVSFFKLAKKNLRKDGSGQKNILTNQDEIKPTQE